MTHQTVHLAVYDGLADWEVGYVTAAINNHQFHRDGRSASITTVGEDQATIRSMGGLAIQPELTLEELDPEASAMLVLPGSGGWDFGGGVDRDRWLWVTRGFRDVGTPVAAICGATFGLASGGLLNDHDHTSSAAEYLEAAPGYAGGDRYREADAVNAGGLITAGPTHPVAFAREILGELDLFTPETLEAWSQLYSTHQPAHYFALMEAVGH